MKLYFIILSFVYLFFLLKWLTLLWSCSFVFEAAVIYSGTDTEHGNGTGCTGTVTFITFLIHESSCEKEWATNRFIASGNRLALMRVHFMYALPVFVCWIFFLDFSFELRSHFVSQVDIELVIPLPQPLQCCGCSGEPPGQLCLLFSVLCRRSAHSVFTSLPGRNET